MDQSDVGEKRKITEACASEDTPVRARPRLADSSELPTESPPDKSSITKDNPETKGVSQDPATKTEKKTSLKAATATYPEYKPPPPKSKIRPKDDGEPYFWKNALNVVATRHEEIDESSIYYVDSKVVVIYDAYPKSKIHLLVIPRYRIESLRSVTKKDLDVLRHMNKVGREIAEKLSDTEKKIRVRIGYHAIPSMPQLHLHVISDDFQGECLRTKKHYNSFTTAFFLEPDVVVSMVDQKGKMEIRPGMDDLLKQNMHCIHCGKGLKNLPVLLKHLLICPERGSDVW